MKYSIQLRPIALSLSVLMLAQASSFAETTSLFDLDHPQNRPSAYNEVNGQRADAAVASGNDLLGLQAELAALPAAQEPAALVPSSSLPAQDSAAMAAWFAQNQHPVSGLVTSHPDDTSYIMFGNIQLYANTQAYTYDQAAAGIAMLQAGNLADAKKIFDRYYSEWQLQQQAGGFTGFWTVYNTDPATDLKYEYRKSAGENIWFALFCIQYESISSSDTEKLNALQMADSIIGWCASLPHTGGGIAMGADRPNGQPNYGRVYSVEANLDYYAALKTLSAIAPTLAERQTFASELNGVRGFLLQSFDVQTGLFRRGGYQDTPGHIQWDAAQSLDVNSWALTAIGPAVLAADFGIDAGSLADRIAVSFAVQNDGSFGGDVAQAKGFDFSDAANAAQIGRPGIKWVEGTNEMVMAYKKLAAYYAEEDAARSAYFAALADHFIARNADNAVVSGNVLSYRYADSEGTRIFADISTSWTSSGPAASSTAWVYYGINGTDPFARPAGGMSGQRLLAYLQSDPVWVAAFNTLYSASIPLTGPATGFDVARIYGLAGDPAFDPTAFLRTLVPTRDLFIAIRSLGALISDFNQVFNANMSWFTPPTVEDLKILFGITGDPAYSASAFIGNLPKAASLHRILKTDAALLADFNRVFKTSITSAGALSGTARKAIFGLVGDPAYAESTLTADLPKAADLLAALQSNTTHAANFNALYGTTITSSGFSKDDVKVLFGITGDPLYPEATFLSMLPKAVSLWTSLKSNTSLRNDFNLLMKSTIAATGPLTAADRSALFGVIGDPAGYVEADFLAILPKTSRLLTDLLSSASTYNNFNALYGTTITSSGFSKDDVKVLFGITGDPLYPEATFLSMLPKAVSLWTSLKSNTSLRNDFNLLMKSTIAATGPLTAADRSALFGVIGDPAGYVEADFLAILPKTSRLLTDLLSSASTYNNFNALYGTTITSSGFSKDDVKVLFGITGDPLYPEATFLSMLPKAVSLWTSLKSNTSLRNDFNLLMKSTIAATGPLTAADRSALFGVIGDPGYVEADLLRLLPLASDLLRSAQSNAPRAADLNLLFATTITPLTFTRFDVQTLFGIAGDSHYVQSVFEALLPKAASLYRLLQSNTMHRNNFNRLFMATIAPAGSPNAHDRTSLFDAVGDPAYDQAAFLDFISAADIFMNKLTAHAYSAQINPIFLSANGFNVLDGITDAVELAKFTAFLSYTPVSQMDATLTFYENIVHLRQTIRDNAAGQAIMDRILLPAYGIDFESASISAQTLRNLTDPDKGILYQANGARANYYAAALFFGDILEFANALEASSLKEAADANLYKRFGLSLLDGISLRDIQIMGAPTTGLLYGSSGARVANDAATIAYWAAHPVATNAGGQRVISVDLFGHGLYPNGTAWSDTSARVADRDDQDNTVFNLSTVTGSISISTADDYMTYWAADAGQLAKYRETLDRMLSALTAEISVEKDAAKRLKSLLAYDLVTQEIMKRIPGAAAKDAYEIQKDRVLDHLAGFVSDPAGEQFNLRKNNEKYFRDSANNLYFVLPNGTVYLFKTSITVSMATPPVARMTAAHYADIRKIYDADITIASNAAELKALDDQFGFILPAAGEQLNKLKAGEKHLTGADGKDYFVLPDGSVYLFRASVALSIKVAQVPVDAFTTASKIYDADITIASNAAELKALDDQFGFILPAAGEQLNKLKAGEKHLTGADGKDYFVLPDGSVYLFRASVALSIKVAQVPVDAFTTASKIYDADITIASNAAELKALDDQFGFILPAAGEQLNKLKAGEKHLTGADGKDYFVLPDGSVYLFRASVALSIKVAQVPVDAFTTASKIYDADITIASNAAELKALDDQFGFILPAAGEQLNKLKAGEKTPHRRRRQRLLCPPRRFGLPVPHIGRALDQGRPGPGGRFHHRLQDLRRRHHHRLKRRRA